MSKGEELFGKKPSSCEILTKSGAVVCNDRVLFKLAEKDEFVFYLREKIIVTSDEPLRTYMNEASLLYKYILDVPKSKQFDFGKNRSSPRLAIRRLFFQLING